MWSHKIIAAAVDYGLIYERYTPENEAQIIIISYTDKAGV